MDCRQFKTQEAEAARQVYTTKADTLRFTDIPQQPNKIIYQQVGGDNNFVSSSRF